MLDAVRTTSVTVSKDTGNTTKFNLITSENLTLRIAETPDEILAAQRLRYDVFYREMGATPLGDTAQREYEVEFYDAYCSHLIVVDRHHADAVVGTYRVLLDKTARQHGIPLCTSTEYDISKLVATGGTIMEISRSCVHPAYRNKAVINLLWKGIATLVFGNDVDYLIGTASLPGTDLGVERDTLAYLKAYHQAPDAICPRALDGHYHPLPDLPKDAIDAKKAFMALPPLIKGYLRCNAVVGDGAYIDHQFNCIDVALVMPIAQVTDRYFNHYKRHAD